MASGTFGYGDDLTDLVDYSKLGAIITKGISLEPRAGNPTPRIIETSAGLINSIGLQNIGLKAFLKDKAPLYPKLKTRVIANIFGTSIEEFNELTDAMNRVEALAGIELNISCPNVKKGGVEFGVDPKATTEVVKNARSRTKLPIIVKLTPNVTDMTIIAKAAADEGADALTVSNTFLSMRIDVLKRRPSLATTFGGISGPAILPIILRQVWQVSSAVKIPVIASGGIMTTHDALEYLMAGATAIQIGTATYINPKAAHEILAGIKDYLTSNNLTLQDLIGIAKEG
ncbi:MAG: dihydroorotate dehydrogenase B catalytic subunit [Deltaproteobacteria bacterium RIFCSPHIGHO2_12_FULL_43_9]|nr:MAG: dihydroorotate dehydrogenase B catalytic subunit [Deltaproteobacteria bacterium RIFCSPHIGHO2_12_FULL_43_9]